MILVLEDRYESPLFIDKKYNCYFGLNWNAVNSWNIPANIQNISAQHGRLILNRLHPLGGT